MRNENLTLTLKEISKKLEGLNWIVLSGLAVKIYVNEKREVNDIDILIPVWSEFQEASKRFGRNVKKRFLKKENFIARDYGFELNVKGMKIEVTGGMWEMKFGNLKSEPVLPKLDKEWVRHAREKEYFGLKLKLQPLEDLIVQKIAMNREKDKKDLECLLTMLKEVDINFLKKDAKNWNCLKKVVSILKI